MEEMRRGVGERRKGVGKRIRGLEKGEGLGEYR